VKIDRNLNLVKKIETDSGTFHVHSMPISRVVWEDNFYIISQAYTSIFAGGFGATTGPKMAALMLRRCAKQAGVEQEYTALMSEIKRLTNVAFSKNGAWQTLPWEVAVSTGQIDEETVAETENAIVFFICASAVLRGAADRAKLEVTLGVMKALWDAETTSLDCTAYAASLQTSIAAAPSTAKRPESSVVY
jgi:hypothetical protein